VEGGTTEDADAVIDTLRHAMRASAALAQSRLPARRLIVDMDPTAQEEQFAEDTSAVVEATYHGAATSIAALRAELLVPIMSAAQAESSSALLLRGFLSDAEMALIFEAAAVMPSPEAAQKDYSAETGAHVALNLHKDGYFASKSPELCSKLVQHMQSQPGRWAEPGSALGVRCIEFHTYTEGGGLMMKDHRDYGSVLTLSVLLSDPQSLEDEHLSEEASGEERERRRKACRSRQKKKNRQVRRAASEADAGRSESRESAGHIAAAIDDPLPITNARSLEAATRLLEASALADIHMTPTELLRVALTRAESEEARPTTYADGSLELGITCSSLPDLGCLELGDESELDVAPPAVAGAATFSGGEFFTWLDGEPNVHVMGRGDAILFHSEKVHNVRPITRGVRHSLVVELWLKPDTISDRYN